MPVARHPYRDQSHAKAALIRRGLGRCAADGPSFFHGFQGRNRCRDTQALQHRTNTPWNELAMTQRLGERLASRGHLQYEPVHTLTRRRDIFFAVGDRSAVDVHVLVQALSCFRVRANLHDRQGGKPNALPRPVVKRQMLQHRRPCPPPTSDRIQACS